jgi:hypothetical protein
MITIVVVRRAFCEVCGKTFDLERDEETPKYCPLCNSYDWEGVKGSQDASLIRKGISKRKRRLNPGAYSRARQQRGKKQWQQFKDKDKNPV